jgi:hypothetical protein
MSKRVVELSPLTVAATVSIAWAVLAGALLVGWTPLTVALGLPLALVTPGRLIVALLRPAARGLECWAVAFGCSLAVLAFCVAVSSALPDGTSTRAVAGTLAAVTALVGALTISSTRGAPVTVRRPSLAGDVRPRWWWVATGLVAGICLVGAVSLSVTSERNSFATPITQLSLVPGSGSLQLEIQNLEGGATTYRLEVHLPGKGPTVRKLTLADGQIYTEVLYPSAAGQVVVSLVGGSATRSHPRQVTAATR